MADSAYRTDRIAVCMAIDGYEILAQLFGHSRYFCIPLLWRYCGYGNLLFAGACVFLLAGFRRRKRMRTDFDVRIDDQ